MKIVDDEFAHSVYPFVSAVETSVDYDDFQLHLFHDNQSAVTFSWKGERIELSASELTTLRDVLSDFIARMHGEKKK